MGAGVREKLTLLLDTYTEIKHSVRKADANLYERWKAGGFLIDDDIVSNYPTIAEVIAELDSEAEEYRG